MAWPVRLCLILRALTWVAQAQECPGASSDMVSRIKFKLYPNSQTFPQPGDGEIDFLNNISTLQDCANHCAVNENCKASVWNDITHDCRLIRDTDGCQDEEPSQHSLWRVGFIDDTGNNIGCSQQEIDKKCSDRETAARLEAEKECTIRSNDLRDEVARLKAENAALRAARNQAERDLADIKTARDEDQKRLNRQCQDKLNDEIEKRRKAVKDAREDAERNCRSKQDIDLRKQLDELRTQCTEDRNRCADDYDRLTQKCADDLSRANQQQKDCDKCNEAIRQKEDQIQQCTDNLKTVKDQQKQSEKQCQAEKANLQKDCDTIRNTDKTLSEATCQAEKEIIKKQCTHDVDAAKSQLKQQLESKCQDEKDIINRQCTYDLDAAKNLQKQLESKCQAEKDVIKKQCTYDLDAAKSQQEQQLESKCQKEKEELNNQCNERVVKEQKTSDETCQRQKDELQKDCDDRSKAQARGKDDICYNPGFGAWPDTIPPFDIDDTNYVLKRNTNLRPGYSREETANSPASCARDFCNNVSDCVAIRWDVNKLNTCHVFIDSPYSPFEKNRLRDYPNSYIIVKTDRMR
ncbi:hypothetical protein FVEN_g11609 [Fusarium venenatum]|uniref:Apple domain-containing protein n=1 Tax=Fusarium venenatum TaxID=56646 RepID=A0A2L2TBV6_9HYPO|nr:uncharacterized protein FVRRES_03921 [Fusarium venenatum]KAG8350206.1 hypothetical protein FVEN_g11609 [Fusarium venenatum]CEI67409.1 unnamed protein product [Fusarium venenatum]